MEMEWGFQDTGWLQGAPGADGGYCHTLPHWASPWALLLAGLSQLFLVWGNQHLRCGQIWSQGLGKPVEEVWDSLWPQWTGWHGRPWHTHRPAPVSPVWAVALGVGWLQDTTLLLTRIPGDLTQASTGPWNTCRWPDSISHSAQQDSAVLLNLYVGGPTCLLAGFQQELWAEGPDLTLRWPLLAAPSMCPGFVLTQTCSMQPWLHHHTGPPGGTQDPRRQALRRQALLWVCSCPNPCEGEKTKTEAGKGLLSVWVGMTCCVDAPRLPAAFMSKSLWSRNHCLQFTDEEMETQGGSVTHPKSQNQFHDGARRVPWLLAQCFSSAVPWLLSEVRKPWSLCSFQAPQPWLLPWAPFLHLCFPGCLPSPLLVPCGP